MSLKGQLSLITALVDVLLDDIFATHHCFPGLVLCQQRCASATVLQIRYAGMGAGWTSADVCMKCQCCRALPIQCITTCSDCAGAVQLQAQCAASALGGPHPGKPKILQVERNCFTFLAHHLPMRCLVKKQGIYGMACLAL